MEAQEILVTEFDSYLELNSSHITRRDVQLLDSEEWLVSTPVRYSYAFGWFVVVPFDDLDDAESAMLASDFSDEFRAILSYAREHGARLVRLDSDAPIREHFPIPNEVAV